MARRRDYRAEYQRRIARGAQLGLPKRLAYGKPKAGETPLRQLQREGRVAKLPPARLPQLPKRVPLGGQSYALRTSSAAELLRAMKDAAAKGHRFAMKVTFDTPDGPRTRKVDGSSVKSPKGRFQPEGPQRPVPMAAGRRKGERVEVVFGPAQAGMWRAQAGHRGRPASEFVDRVGLYRAAGETPAQAVWNAVHDMWTEAGE
jgi:hypothetical protein